MSTEGLRMNARVFSLLLLASQLPSMTTVDPVGLKVRITDTALDVLKDQAQAVIQDQLVDKPFEDFDYLNCKVSNLKFTQIIIDQVDLRFQENSGFQLEIQNSAASIAFDHQTNCYFFTTQMSPILEAVGVAISIQVSLGRNEDGRLVADMAACEASAEGLRLGSPGLVRTVTEKLNGLLTYIFGYVFCPGVRTFGLPYVNQMLVSMPMTAELSKGVMIDYSLTRNIHVTTSYLEMSFKGRVYRQGGDTDGKEGAADPVFRDDARMAYVAFSDFLLNTAVEAFYDAGAMETEEDVGAGIRVKVGLTEAPSISIAQHGLTFNMRAKAKVTKMAGRENPNFPSLSAECSVTVKVSVEENRLMLRDNEVNCKIITKNKIREFLLKPVKALLNRKARNTLTDWFQGGVEIPLPQGLSFTQGTIEFYDGFVVVGGDLSFGCQGDDGEEGEEDPPV